MRDNKDKFGCDICGKDLYRDILRNTEEFLKIFFFDSSTTMLVPSAHTSDHMIWYKNLDVKDGEISHLANGE